jgi:tetratricopeptide (TPR) repeat protein
VVGRFEMVKEIGSGGFGVVFEARDKDLGRSVAFKAVRPGVRTRQLDTMLLQEAESAARLQHENIVSIFDYGQSDAGPYLVLELLKGETLAARLARGPLPVHEAVHVGTQVARALAHAHGAGLLHRDLKPGNVFLTQSGGVKVMDLGLAHFFGQPTGLSGTPAYMAPEQWKGEAQDGRTDVFALGVTLFEMLAARRPYEVRSDRSTVLDPGPEPKLEAHHVPARLRKLVERCIAKDPAKRPASARAVQEELLVVERGLATGEARKGQLFLVLVLGGVLTVLGVAGAAAWKFWPRQIVKGAPRTVLVADFDNRTGEEVFNGTLEPAVGLTLEGASFISAYSRGTAKKVADQLKLPGSGLPEARARLVAQREGIATVVSGFVEKEGTGYKLGARTIDAFSGKPLLDKVESAADHGGVLAAASKLAAKVRVSLGDSTPESTLLKEAETFSATSLEAAHEYSVANELALTQGKYPEAEKHYLEAIRLDPGMGRAYSGLAVMEANRGHGADAEVHFQKGLTLVDRMTEREKFRTRGNYYTFKRDADKAIEAYEGLVKQFPADNAGLANLGLAYVFKGDFPRALDYTRKALSLYPQNVPQRNNAGYFAMYAGDFPAALQDQQKVLQQNPGFVNGYIGLALAQEASGARDEAVATWKKLEALGPAEASAAVEGLADLAVLEGRLGDASAGLEKGIQADLGMKDNANAARKLVMLAGVHLARGDAVRAAEAASKGAALSQQDYVQYLAARVLLDAGQEKRAVSIAERLGKQFEAAPRVYAELLNGAVSLQRKNTTEAIARFKAGQKLLDLWLVRYELGRAYLAAGAPAQAQDEFEASIRRSGEVTDVFVDNVPTYRLLGPVLYWKARAQEAQKSSAAAETYRAFLATKKTDEDPLVIDARKRVATLSLP